MNELYRSIEAVTETQEWLSLFILDHKRVIESYSLGMCYNSAMGTGYYIIGDISRAVNRTGFVINDTSSTLTEAWQYLGLPKYEGTQLELRKEFAQLCIDYLSEAIRI